MDVSPNDVQILLALPVSWAMITKLVGRIVEIFLYISAGSRIYIRYHQQARLWRINLQFRPMMRAKNELRERYRRSPRQDPASW
jgi:hypothetical protein